MVMISTCLVAVNDDDESGSGVNEHDGRRVSARRVANLVQILRGRESGMPVCVLSVQSMLARKEVGQVTPRSLSALVSRDVERKAAQS